MVVHNFNGLASIALVSLAFAACGKESAPTVTASPIPIVVLNDGEVVSTFGRVWVSNPNNRDGSRTRRLVEDGTLNDIAVYIYDKDTIYNQERLVDSSGLPKAVVSPGDSVWANALSHDALYDRVLASRYFPGQTPEAALIRMVDVAWCVPTEPCELTIRFHADAVTAEALRDSLWDSSGEGWYESTLTMPARDWGSEGFVDDLPWHIVVSFDGDEATVGFNGWGVDRPLASAKVQALGEQR